MTCGDALGSCEPCDMTRKVRRIGLILPFVCLTSCAVFGPVYSLHLSVSGNGSISADPDSPGPLRQGDTVTITAAPDWGWRFDHWEGALSGSENPATVIMHGDKSVGAVFTAEWHFSSSSGWSFHSSPAVGTDGTVYIGSRDNNLYAINPDASLKWTFATGGFVASPAVGADGTVYASSGDSSLYALTPQGVERWAFDTGDILYTTPAIGADGAVYLGSQGGSLYAIDPAGIERWSVSLGEMAQVNSAPSIARDGTIYVGVRSGSGARLYAFDAEGEQKWSVFLGQCVITSTAIGPDGTVYASCGTKLHAVNPEGSVKWAFSTSKGVVGSPAIGTDGTLYVGSAEGKLWGVHPDGTQSWSFEISGGTVSSHAAVGSDGTIYVGCAQGLSAGLYAVNPDGSRKSHFPAADGSTNPVVGADGMLYFASGDSVYGIITGSGGLADSGWPMFRQNQRHTGLQPGP